MDQLADANNASEGGDFSDIAVTHSLVWRDDAIWGSLILLGFPFGFQQSFGVAGALRLGLGCVAFRRL